MPAPELNPDLLEGAPDDGASLGTTTRGNHATHGDAYSGGNQHIEKSCVVRQNIYCAKALEASAYTVRTSSYGDSNDPQFDDEHVYHSVISAGFVKNDVNGNFLFGEAGDGGATALDQLTDVTLTGPLAGREYLCFDSGSQEWVNQVIVLDDLGDAVILSPADGDYLCYDGANWINAGIPLGDLSNVSTAAATIGGEVLQFDGASDFFFGFLNLNSLSNVDLTGQNSGDHLEFDGINWVPAAPGHTAPGAVSLDDLSDVSLSGEAEGDFLRLNGSGQFVNTTIVDGDVPNTLTFQNLLSATALTELRDDSGNIIIRFQRFGTATNFFNIGNGGPGFGPILETKGSDTNVEMLFKTRGTADFVFLNGSVVELARLGAAGIEVQSDDAYYIGEKDTNGTWRFVRNGSDLQVELRELGTYNVKGSFTP